MADFGWDDIDTNFGDGEETVNFGPRMESGSALYQVETMATISHREKASKVPQVYGVSTEDVSCIVAGAQLSLFADACRKFLITHRFEAEVDAVAITEDGYFVVVGDASGAVHFFDCQSQARLFSNMLVSIQESHDEKVFEHLCFTAVDEQGCCSLLVTTSNKVHVLENFQPETLKEALQNKDIQKAKELHAGIHQVALDTSRVHVERTMHTVAGSRPGTLFTVGAGENSLCFWEMVNSEYVPVKMLASCIIGGAAIKKCILTKCGNLLFILDDQGVLSLLSVQLLILVKQWRHMVVKDCSLLETGGETSRLDDIKMALLKSSPDGSSVLEICSLPTLESVYSLVLSPHTFLVQPETAQDTICLVEGVPKDGGSGELVSTLRIRTLTEAHPETRLYRLLHKRQYKEAENFAKLYDQDVELVYKAQCSNLFDILSPWNVGQLSAQETSDHIQQLRNCLELVKDDMFVAKSCTKAALPTFQMTFDLLTFTKQRLSKEAASGPAGDRNRTGKLLTKTLEMLYRLGTYQVAFGIEAFSGESWDEFLKVNMLKEVMSHLQEGSIQTAVIIWNRHQGEYVEEFNAEILQDILNSVPEQTPSQELTPWLTQDLIPYILRKCADGLPIIASWIEQRARNMEIYGKDGWPANSLEFSELFQHTCVSVSHFKNEMGLATPEELSTQICNLPAGFYQMKYKSDDSAEDRLSNAFHSLNTLIFQLRELLNLHTKYKCRLSLAEFVRETTESLTYRMLDRVGAVELIPSAIDKFVRPYMREHKLSEDKTLFQYIGDLAKRSSNTRGARVGQTHWEAKAIAVISCINDQDYKLQGIHDAMKRAYVPWSKDMEELVQAALVLDHPRVAELKELYMLTELHKMLIQYDLHNFNQRNTNAKTLVYYILRHDRPTAMQDALQAVQANDKLEDTEAYNFRIAFLIEQDRLTECLELIRTLPEEKAVICGKNLVIHAITLLNSKISFDEEHDQEMCEKKMVYTRAACQILKVILSHSLQPLEKEELQAVLEDLTKIFALQVEFGEFISYKEYQNEDHRLRLLYKYVGEFFTHETNRQQLDIKVQIQSERKTSSDKKLSNAKIFRLGELLNCPKKTLRTQIALHASMSEKGSVEVAVQQAKELYADLPCPETARSLFQISHALCQQFSEKADKLPSATTIAVLDEVHEMARQALVYCEQDLVSDCLELCKCLSQTRDVMRNCESGDYGTTVLSVADDGTEHSSKDPYKEWTFDHFFQEEGLVMDSSVATPLAYKHCIASIPTRVTGHKPYTENRVQGTAHNMDSGSPSPVAPLGVAAKNLVQYLLQNGYMEMALGVSTDSLCSSLRHLSIQDMSEAKAEVLLQEINKVTEAHKSCNFNLTCNVLKKVLNKSRIDHQLALGYLCDLPKKVAMEMLKKMTQMVRNQFKKLLVLARLGIDLSEITKEGKVKKFWDEYAINSEWGMKLAKLKIPFKDLFKTSKTEKPKLIPDLVSSKHVTINIIEEFCSAYDLDSEDAILLYVEKLLVPNPAGNKSCDDSENNQVAAQKKASLEKARCAIKKVKATELKVKTLYQIFEKLDFYDYDAISFVLESLKRHDPSDQISKGEELITKLKVYQRVAAPSQYEIDYRPITEEEQVMCGNQKLSPLSTVRLPLHHLLYGEPWKIITPELNAVTVDMLWPIASILELSSDAMYTATIRNIVSTHISDSKSLAAAANPNNVDKAKCSWRLERDVEEKFFPTLTRLLGKISSCEKAVACCSYIMKELPIGAEKVMALRACVEFTKRWAAECDANQHGEQNNALAMHERFFTWHKRLSIEQVLCQHNVGEPDLLKMSSNAVKLIFKLYEHDSILQRLKPGVVVDSLPDIHKITDDISNIADVNISQIRLSLMEKWLPSTRQDDIDMTFNLSTINMDATMMGEEEGITQDEINLQRVIYLMQNEKNSPLFLLNYSMQSDCTNITNLCRVRALRCLFSLLDLKTVNKMLKMSDNAVKLDDLLKKLVYLVNLDKLHMPQTLDAFTTCNKDGLVRGIWMNHSHDRQAVRLVSDMCLDYHIHDVQLWNSVLQQLMGFQMVDYLRHILVRLSYDPELWKVASYHRTWARVILLPLSSVVPPLSDEQQAECLDSYRLVYRCPLILDLDLPSFAKQFLRLDLPACALGCLLLVAEDDTRVTQVNGLLNQEGQVKVILDQLKHWTDKNMILPMMQQIQHAIYSHINKSKAYPLLQGTGLECNFAVYLAQKGEINDLLSFSVTTDRMAEAVQLVLLFENLHPNSEFARAAGQEEHLKKLQMYVEMNDLSDLKEHLPVPKVESDQDNDSDGDYQDII